MFILMDKTNTSLTITCIKKVKAAFRCNTINGPDLIHVGPEPHVILYMKTTRTHTLSLSVSVYFPIYNTLTIYALKVFRISLKEWWRRRRRKRRRSCIELLILKGWTTCKVKTRRGSQQRARSRAHNGLMIVLIMAKENRNSTPCSCRLTLQRVSTTDSVSCMSPGGWT